MRGDLQTTPLKCRLTATGHSLHGARQVRANEVAALSKLGFGFGVNASTKVRKSFKTPSQRHGSASSLRRGSGGTY